MATKLKITSLKFISAVDAGAQGAIANVALVKRAPAGSAQGDEYRLTAKVEKIDTTLGVVIGYALATTLDGGKTPHVDLQGDAIVGDDLMKIALAFAEAGAQSDVMHDCKADGWCPFILPLDAETKKALKLSGDVDGIAVGMKPSVETFKRFQSGELAAFSIYGTGIREPLEGKRAPKPGIAKRGLLTSAVDGHSHLLDDQDGAGSGYTSCEVMGEGQSATWHSHPWSRDDGGDIVIGMSANHSHDVLDPANTDEAATESAKRAAAVAAKSTAPVGARSLGVTSQETTQMKTDAEKLADLQKRHSLITKFAPALFAHFVTLSTDAQDDFLVKTASEREAIVADVAKRVEDGNKPVYVSKTDGTVFFAKDDSRLVEMAKRLDTEAEKVEKAEIASIAKAKLGDLTGDAATHELIVRALRKSGEKAEDVEKALTAIGGWSELVKSGGGKAKGSGGSEDPTGGDAESALAAYTKGLEAYCQTQKIEKVWTVGHEAYKTTSEGAALKRAYDEVAAS